MEAGWFKSDRSGGLTGELPMVIFFSFGRRDVADWPQQSVVFEPREPFERCQFDGLLGFPGPAPVDQFCLVQAVNRLG